MKVAGTRTYQVGNSFFSIGWNFASIGLGIVITRYSVMIDLPFCWISLEY
jgi:hypothetical protein